MNTKIKVYTTYDYPNDTWDVLEEDSNNCLVFGSIDKIEEWLTDHSDTHEEIFNDYTN